MNKSEFTRYYAQKYHISYPVAKKIVDDIFPALAEAIIKDNSVSITGFGNFYIKRHKGAIVNGINGEKTNVDAFYVLGFKATSFLKKAINFYKKEEYKNGVINDTKEPKILMDDSDEESVSDENNSD